MDGFQKRAILIGPSYSKLPRDQWLDAIETDVQTMKNALTGKFKFKEEDIKVLHDNQATKENILKELSELTKSCEPRSVVCLYYSGHGSYLTDSQDEGLLPTVLEWPPHKPMEEICITGQDLRPFFEELSKKDVYITLIFDCCHSGYLYRDVDVQKGIKIKQVVLPEPTTKSCDAESENKKYTKADRGGWTPESKDHFFYIAACTSEQKATEIPGGGLLTLSIMATLDKLKSFDQVNYKAFFRLLMNEVQILKNNQERGKIKQMPQFESVNSNTALFGISQVEEAEGGVEIIDVIFEDEFLLNAGFVQGLRAGTYSVFEATASAESVKKGASSPDCLGTITINDGQMSAADATASADCIRRPITCGCLAYLESPDSFSESVYITPDSVHEKNREILVKELKDTRMFNVFRNLPKVVNPHLITITCETIESKSCWVARKGGKIFVPPISAGINQEIIMVKNLQRYTKYQLVQDIAYPPKNENLLLENVSFKVFKAKEVTRWRPSRKEEMITKELEKASTVEITKENDRRIILKAHKPKGRSIEYGTGDSFIYQVKNENKTDQVHICVILCQCDGEIKAIYPPKEGGTTPLPAGDTVVDIQHVFLPGDCLRAMEEPDLTEKEPDLTFDTLILLASSKPVTYEALLQSALQTDDSLLRSKSKGLSSDQDLVGSIEKLCKIKKRNGVNDDMVEMKYMYKKVQIFESP